MRLAIYIENFLANSQNDEDGFIIQMFLRMAQLHPESDFIFITGKGASQNFLSEKNMVQVAAAPVSTNTLVWKWWLDIRFPRLLKKYKADILITKTTCSLNTKIPQCLLVLDHSILLQSGKLKRTHRVFYKKYMSKFLQQAKSIICFSSFIKKGIVKSSGENSYSLKLIPPAAEEIFGPLSESDKNKTKETLTGGHEYFLYTGELSDDKTLVELLKAFSVFKKMQQSNMRLVLGGEIHPSYKKFKEALKTYKYRDTVLIKKPGSRQELAVLLGSAYALILPSERTGLRVRLLQALQSGIPVISVQDELVQETASDAVLYFKAGDHSGLAAQMMNMYKDEDRRKKLIEKEKRIMTKYSMDNSVKLLWQAIEDALK